MVVVGVPRIYWTIHLDLLQRPIGAAVSVAAAAEGEEVGVVTVHWQLPLLVRPLGA